MSAKSSRLKKKKDIEEVLKKGKGFKEDFLALKITKNKIGKVRLGIIVSKKVSPKATTRNKIRRRIANLVKLQINKFKMGADIVLIALPGLETKDFWEIEEALNKLFQNLF